MLVIAREVMSSPVIAVNQKSTLQDAIELIAGHAFSGLPVVDDQNKLVGILSEADILKYSYQEKVVPLISLSGWISPYTKITDMAIVKKGIETLSHASVEKAMNKKITTALPDTPIMDITKLMSKKNINRIPIVDEEGIIIGIITRADVIRNLAEIQ